MHTAYNDVRIVTLVIVVANGTGTTKFSAGTNPLNTGKPVAPNQSGVCWCRNVTPPNAGGSFTGYVTNNGGKNHDYISGSANGSIQEFSDQMIWHQEVSYTITGANGTYTLDFWLI